MPTAPPAEASAPPPEFERQALEALKAPELYEPVLPSGFTTVARLWHYAGEGVWRAWSVSSRPSAIDASPLRVRRLEWDRPGQGADALVPRLALFEGRFPMESWDALLQEAHTLRVPPLLLEAERPPGGSRDRAGFSYRLATRTVSFEWWDAPPEEWRELAEWARKVREVLDAWVRR